MVSLSDELEAREAAARVRVEVLEAEIAELTVRLEGGREAWSRLRNARETVAEVIAELSAEGAAAAVAVPIVERSVPGVSVESGVRMVGAVMVPHWRPGLSVDVLPDAYRDIVEVVADAPGPMQAKQIVPRIGLPAVTGKIEGTRGKLKRLVERGWLVGVHPRQLAPAHRGWGGVGC
ncbi:hypothetical protein [Streptomyces violascens]|uniref:hypothetical protein n=1 Tax=Streptomyces violascens TaxID=67381 RepID=UPI0036B9E948